MKKTNIVLIPAYEPDNKLIKLVKELAKEKFDIIIVDDGSGASYKEIFNECENCSLVISYNMNKGKGHALKRGFRHIKNNYKEPYTIVTMDCDGQHTVDDAKKLIEEIQNNEKVLILGKRTRNETTPLRSKIGNAITRLIFRVATNLDIYDTQTGLRVFNNTLIDYLIQIEGTRFEYEMNVLLSCARDKIKMKEIEIKTIYIDNNSGSHFNTIKDSYRIYKDIIKQSIIKRGK